MSLHNKIENTLNILPLNSQREFRKALQHQIFTNEMTIPKNFEGKRLELNKDIMRNYLANFQKNYKKRNKYLQQVNKEISDFSKGYAGITELNIKKKKEREKLVFGDLIEQYNKKGYETKKLYVNKNLFKKSVLLEQNDYTNVLKLHDNKEIKHAQSYMNKLDILLQTNKKKDFYFQTALSEDDRKENLDDEYPDNYDFKKNNLLLKYDILKTKKTIDDTLPTDPNFIERTYSNLSYNPTKSNSETQLKFNSTIDTNFTTKNKFIYENKKGKKILFPEKKLILNHIKSDKELTNVSPLSTTDNKSSNTYERVISSKDLRTNRNQSEGRLTFEMKKKLHEEMMNNLSNLYENVKKSNFEESENRILKYLLKYEQKLPDKVKYEFNIFKYLISFKEGSNLHGFINRFHTKTQKMNVPKKIRKLIVKTGDYSVKLPHLLKEVEIGKKIEEIDYNYIDDILKMNEHLKHSK